MQGTAFYAGKHPGTQDGRQAAEHVEWVDREGKNLYNEKNVCTKQTSEAEASCPILQAPAQTSMSKAYDLSTGKAVCLFLFVKGMRLLRHEKGMLK